MTGDARGTVVAVNPASTFGPATVDVDFLGSVVPGLRYPVWYTPQVNDAVIVRWIGSTPYVSTAFA